MTHVQSHQAPFYDEIFDDFPCDEKLDQFNFSSCALRSSKHKPIKLQVVI